MPPEIGRNRRRDDEARMGEQVPLVMGESFKWARRRARTIICDHEEINVGDTGMSDCSYLEARLNEGLCC
jgi:hypothetical protein